MVNSPILPTPWATAEAFVTSFGPRLAGDMLTSTLRVIVATALAVVVAWPVGLGLGISPKVDRFVAPLIYFTYPIPKIVLLPVIILALGLGESSKITILFLILFFQVLIVVRDAAKSIRGELVLSVRSLGARRRHLLRYVYFPACLPALLTALRVSTGTAVAVLFFVESFGSSSGLGYFILVESQQRLDYPRMYAGMVAMSILGASMYLVLDLVQRRVSRWSSNGAL